MGIQDRDYYRVSASSRARARGPSTARIALFWTVLGAILFAAFRFGPTLMPHTTVVAPVTVPLTQRTTVVSSPKPAPFAVPLPPPSPTAERSDAPIYRCGNAYGREPCSDSRVVAPPAATGFDSRPSERLARLVADGRETVTTVSTSHSSIQTATVFGRTDSCGSLAADIAAIDADARNPRSAPHQDLLRERRRAARDRQASLHC